MSDKRSSYRQIMKTTSIFGGVQFFQIIINIVRSKFIAVLLGPGGMGIAGLLTSTTGFIAALTNFGLSTSAVKNVSAAYSSGNSRRLSVVVTVFRRWVWITGILGALATAIFSPWLSQITFGSKEYTFAFIWISITLLLNQISAGQGVILRGTRQIAYLAKSGVIGSIIGLCTTVPLYYFFGKDGIVPAIIISSVTALVLTWYFSRKVGIQQVYVSKARTVAEGKEMLTMGFMISLSSLITLGASYVVRIFISRTGGVDQVGLYNAGFAIVNTYVGMIFTAMSTDYYPRLSAVSEDNKQSRNTINQQAEIAVLILAPILIIFLVFIKWIIILFYSNMFIGASDMIYWATLGIFFKAVSWSVAFIFLAKGATKLFFWNELITNIYMLVLNIGGYYLFGLTGLGLSFFLVYLIYAFQVYFVAKAKYDFIFTKELLKIFIIQFGLAFLSFVVVRYVHNDLYYYFLGGIIIVVSTLSSFVELDKRLNVKSIVSDRVKSLWRRKN
ncbi:MAG: O-antigen translocase [Paludibacter sp.]|nr:O-antigen translocase [Paludibacter sp.]